MLILQYFYFDITIFRFKRLHVLLLVIIMLEGYSWSYLLMPVLIGALIIDLIGLIFNNLINSRKYPLFW